MTFNDEWYMPVWLNSYLLNPLKIVFKVLNNVVDLLIIITKFTFVLAIISSKNLPKPFSKIEEYANLLGKFVTEKVTKNSQKVQEEEKNIKVCPNCGNELNKTATFCNKCGTKQ